MRELMCRMVLMHLLICAGIFMLHCCNRLQLAVKLSQQETALVENERLRLDMQNHDMGSAIRRLDKLVYGGSKSSSTSSHARSKASRSALMSSSSYLASSSSPSSSRMFTSSTARGSASTLASTRTSRARLKAHSATRLKKRTGTKQQKNSKAKGSEKKRKKKKKEKRAGEAPSFARTTSSWALRTQSS